MQIQLFDSYPYRPLGSVLRPWLARAQRVDAAVAFVTRAGMATFRQFLKARPQNAGLLVASVRFPTNLSELAKLEDDFPGTVFLHTGFQIPQEKEAERGQFHSKVMLLELSGNDRCLIVGSHNWTENALEGYNLEAGVVIHCQETDPIIAQTRQHIQNCANRSERFDRKRLRFYEAVQRDLHKNSGPRGQESEPFPGFQEHPAVVIHAEDSTDSGLPDPAQLFIPIYDQATYQTFSNAPRVGADQRITLHLYPAGTLIGQSPPRQSPVELQGVVTLQNTVADAPVVQRSVNCELPDLQTPRIVSVPGGTVPPPRGERYQVVIRLQRTETTDLPIYQAAPQTPKMQVGVIYEVVDRDLGAEADALIHAPWSEELESDAETSARPLPVYKAPCRLSVKCTFHVPNQDLYRHDIKQQLPYVLTGSDFFETSTEEDLTLKPPPRNRVLNRYVYHVQHRLTEDTVKRIQKQLPLFPT